MIRTGHARPAVRHCHPARHSHPVRHRARWSPRIPPGTWPRLARELALIATFAVLYEEIRDHLVQAGAAAASHALAVVHLEQALGLFHEQAVQAAILRSDTVTDAFNAYYGGTHFLVPGAILAWLLFRHPAHYARARTALAVSTGLAFIVFWLYPVAPPRLLPAHYGIIDTLVTRSGSGHFDSVLISTAGDQYASMPSVHVAWAVWCALALYPVARHWTVRALAIAYPLLTTLVVVATGNHFFLDVIAGALLAGVTWVVVTRAGAWLTVRIATRRAAGAGPAGLVIPAPRGPGRGAAGPPRLRIWRAHRPAAFGEIRPRRE
jgi:membrane-associated phospholipid phosphatase